MNSTTWARLAAVTMTTLGALALGGTTAVADPPPGWAPTGPNAVQYDSGWLVWAHHGRYADAPGNWHTGHVDVDESDDGLTGGLYDWKCPRGIRPLPADNPFPSACTLLRGRGLDSTSTVAPTHEAEFEWARNRLTIHHDIPVFDFDDTRLGTVRIDVTMQGRGRPETFTDTTNGSLDYWERYTHGRSWGRVDGHRVHGRHTRQHNFSAGSSVSGWQHIP